MHIRNLIRIEYIHTDLIILKWDSQGAIKSSDGISFSALVLLVNALYVSAIT